MRCRESGRCKKRKIRQRMSSEQAANESFRYREAYTGKTPEGAADSELFFFGESFVFVKKHLHISGQRRMKMKKLSCDRMRKFQFG